MIPTGNQTLAPVRDLLALTGLGREPRLVWLVAAMVFLALAESLALLLIVPLLKWASGEHVANATGLLALLAFTAIARAAVGFWLRIRTVELQHRAKDGLRLQVYGSLLNAEWRWLSLSKSEDHAQILIGGIGQVCGNGISILIGLAARLCLLAGYVIVAFLLSWQVALIAISAASVMAWLLRNQRRRALRQGEVLTSANKAMIRFLKGGLAQMRELKITRGEARFLNEFDEVNGRFRQEQLAYARQEAQISAVMQLSLMVAVLLLAWGSVALSGLELAQLVPAILLVMRISPMLTNVHADYDSWLLTAPQVAATRTLLHDSLAHAEAMEVDGHPPLPLRRAIELKGVSVRYATRSALALNAVSLTIAANSTTIITGRSGSGKSTLADLLMGLIEPDAGTMSIDGVTLSPERRRQWRASVGYVQQHATLFDDTIRANLLWGRPSASDAELEQALALASAGFVMELPDGLGSLVGEAGLRLSGGERQRIALARVLLRQPTLLILDEATSALDRENEAAINQAIAGLAGRMTIVIIGHRQAHRDGADQIVTLTNGKLATS